MKGFSKTDLLLITSSDIGVFASIGAFVVAVLALGFNRLGSLLKDKGDNIAISTKLDRALQDIEKNQDDIEDVQRAVSKIEITVEHLNTNCNNFHKNTDNY